MAGDDAAKAAGLCVGANMPSGQSLNVPAHDHVCHGEQEEVGGAAQLPPSAPALCVSCALVPVQEVVAILGSDFPFQVVNHSVDLPELQGEPDDVSREKCRMASKAVRALRCHPASRL